MPETVKARYSKGALIPLEPLDLKEGEEVTVSIEDTHPANQSPSPLRHVAGAWKGTHDPEELLRNIYSDRVPVSTFCHSDRSEAERGILCDVGGGTVGESGVRQAAGIVVSKDRALACAAAPMLIKARTVARVNQPAPARKG